MATAICDSTSFHPTIATLLARQQVLNERPVSLAVTSEMIALDRMLLGTPARTLSDVALKLRELIDRLECEDSAHLDLAQSCLRDMSVLQ